MKSEIEFQDITPKGKCMCCPWGGKVVILDSTTCLCTFSVHFVQALFLYLYTSTDSGYITTGGGVMEDRNVVEGIEGSGGELWKACAFPLMQYLNSP